LDISKIIYNSTKDIYKYITDRDPFFKFNGSFWVECNADVVLRTHINELLESYKNYEINEKLKLGTLLRNKKKS
jgi:hypothetical protein